MLKQQSFETMKRNGYLDPVDFDLKAVDRDAMIEAVGPLVSIGYEIEGDTVSTAEVVRLLAPGEHVDLWEGQELWHALIYAEIAREIGIDLPELEYREPDALMRRLGSWRESSSMTANILGMIVAMEGYKNEGQNMRAQRRGVQRLRAVGEQGIASAISAMYKQEAPHAAFYLADLDERRTRHPVEYRITKRLALRDSRPIGANTPERMVRVGAVMSEMFDGDEIVDLVRDITTPLDFSRKQQQSLAGGLEECVLAYKTA